ncbi:MAG TPA: hypothetical protein VGC39_11820 [Candidatus Methylacidiphilales bacterium]
MQTKRFFSWSQWGAAAFCAALAISGTAWAQNAGHVSEAFQTARQAISPEIQTKVVSVYGIGTPEAIQKWYMIFYDSSVASHGRAVLVENNQIVKTYPANGGTVYSANLTFDPSRITSEGPVLSAAQGYAAKHNIVYDSVHALLKQASVDKPFRWRVELIHSGQSRGFVYVNALDDAVAYYTPASTGDGESSGKSSSSDSSAKGFSHDVQKTFLGIGGDLEEFFTGERTVDR